jgi:hypothetical protein
VPRTGFSIPVFPPDELGPNVLDTNDWNYRFVSFEYENDEEMYITDPCLLVDSEPEPPSRDGTYDIGNKTITIHPSRTGERTVCDCSGSSIVEGTCATTALPEDSNIGQITLQNVLTVRVQGLDLPDLTRPCAPGQDPIWTVPYLMIYVTRSNLPDETLVAKGFGYSRYAAGQYYSTTESRTVEIEIADDPEVLIPIEDFQRLS